MTAFHDFTMDDIAGRPLSFERYRGRPCLVVNVASRCGLTPQYEGLEKLEQAGRLSVLGFPCNQFGGQEPGSNEEVCEFAQSRFQATFQLFAKVEVNGDSACALYQHLKAQQSRPDGEPDIAWNFTKFLVGGDGAVLKRFEPGVTPEQIAAKLAELV